MTSEQPNRHVVEAPKPLSQSLIWKLQRRFFEETGPKAWSRGIVPHYITSNPSIAAAYARVVWSFVEDSHDAGVDPSQPMYILEIASGSGRFAFYFLKELCRLHERSRLRRARLTYVMTDLAASNIESWRRHPLLQPFVQRGVLDFAHFDGEKEDELVLLESGRRLAPGKLTNPLVVLANYYFDGIPQDAFRVDRGRLHESLVSVTSPQPEPDAEDPALLQRAVLVYEDGAAGDDYYDDPELNRVLAQYRDQLPDGPFGFPSAGMRCCRFLRRLAGDRLLLLSCDKGFSDEEGVVLHGAPGLVAHGSFSMGVNYHAIGQYFRNAGGEVLAPEHLNHSLCVMAALMGPGPHTATRAAFTDHVIDFGPDEFFVVKRACDPHLGSFRLSEMLAFIRMSHFDPWVLDQCLAALAQQLPQATRVERRELQAVIDRVWENFFPIGERNDLAFKIGLLLFQMEHFAEAIAFFRRSQELCGPSGGALVNMAICLYRLRRFADAAVHVAEALRLEPGNPAARALRLELKQLLPEARVEVRRPRLEVA